MYTTTITTAIQIETYHSDHQPGRTCIQLSDPRVCNVCDMHIFVHFIKSWHQETKQKSMHMHAFEMHQAPRPRKEAPPVWTAIVKSQNADSQPEPARQATLMCRIDKLHCISLTLVTSPLSSHRSSYKVTLTQLQKPHVHQSLDELHAGSLDVPATSGVMQQALPRLTTSRSAATAPAAAPV